MNRLAAERVPSPRAVFVEQIRAVGLAVRRDALLAGVFLGLPWLVMAFLIRSGLVVADGHGWDGAPLDPGEGFAPIAALLAALFALLVWKGERTFGSTPLWSLPVGHRRHALTKVAAGWIWILALLGALWVWIVVMAMTAGSALGIEETRTLVLDHAGAGMGAPGATTTVAWVTPWWEWVMPFTAATAAYLLASALVLATPRPLPWGVGLWFLLLVTGAAAQQMGLGWLTRGFVSPLHVLGAWDGLGTILTLPSGSRVRAWLTLPTASIWASASAIWIGVGLASVSGAVARHRDH